MSLTHVRSAIAESVYLRFWVQNVGCVYYCCCFCCIWWPISEKSPTDAKKSRRYLLHKPSYSQFCPKFRCHGNGGRLEENAIGSILWPIPENPPIGAKISQKSLTQAEL